MPSKVPMDDVFTAMSPTMVSEILGNDARTRLPHYPSVSTKTRARRAQHRHRAQQPATPLSEGYLTPKPDVLASESLRPRTLQSYMEPAATTPPPPPLTQQHGQQKKLIFGIDEKWVFLGIGITVGVAVLVGGFFVVRYLLKQNKAQQAQARQAPQAQVQPRLVNMPGSYTTNANANSGQYTAPVDETSDGTTESDTSSSDSQPRKVRKHRNKRPKSKTHTKRHKRHRNRQKYEELSTTSDDASDDDASGAFPMISEVTSSETSESDLSEDRRNYTGAQPVHNTHTSSNEEVSDVSDTAHSDTESRYQPTIPEELLQAIEIQRKSNENARKRLQQQKQQLEEYHKAQPQQQPQQQPRPQPQQQQPPREPRQAPPQKPPQEPPQEPQEPPQEQPQGPPQEQPREPSPSAVQAKYDQDLLNLVSGYHE